MLITVTEVITKNSNNTEGNRTYTLEENEVDAWAVRKISTDTCLKRTFDEHPDYFPEGLDRNHTFVRLHLDRGHGMEVTVVGGKKEIRDRVNMARKGENIRG